MDNSYNQSSITRLKDEHQVRDKVSVIFGTNDASGAAHGIYEIIANSIDEAREGYGKQIRVKIKDTGDVEVSDDGRGVPMDWNPAEKEYNWKLVFCTLYASGKYNSANYSGALGTNGLGATAMQYASEYMDVYSTRDNSTYHMHFEKGRPVGQLEKLSPMRDGTGTTIRFKPDPEVFIGIKDKPYESAEYYINLLRSQAMLHPGLEIVLEHPEIESAVSILYKNGTREYIDKVCKRPMLKESVSFEDNVVTSNAEAADKSEFNLNMQIAFNFTREFSDSGVDTIELYHNGSNLFEGGETMDALKAGFTSAFNEIAKMNNKLKSSDRFLYRDVEGILVAVGATNAPGFQSFFKNQTKGALNNKNFGRAYAEFVANSVIDWYKANKDIALKVVDEIVINKQSREEGEKVSKKVINSLSKPVSGVGNKPKKFVDCNSTFIPEKEIWIVEGDSAAGSCKLARDNKFQAIMPVRGKIINCLKEDLGRILNSDIINDLLRVLGCGIEAKSKYIKDLPPFDINKLNWGKIIICTDADIDGMQIRTLIITMIYRLCPSLLKAGKVYIAETPLFEIIYKGDTKFAYNDAEKAAIMNEYARLGIKDSQIKVNRSKGLGENDPDMMNISTMNPATRRLIPIEYPEDEGTMIEVFNSLLGSDIEARREMIQEYFSMTKVDIE
ncbi:MAG: DNA topoisomerase [Lachnospiraceae bacterium]|nr:DNA topoisomerase [Lachnospiraceae bacterium]